MTTTTPAVRSVAGVFPNAGFHWVGNGFHVSSYFPRRGLTAERVSPFLLMDYGPPTEFAPLPSGQRGVGWHPHRGFETVTLAWEGAVAHGDSLGNVGVIGPGDVQWMTAAGGILHQEFHEESFARRGGRMHMMQLWVNLPKVHKLDPPGYQPIVAADIPVVAVADDGGTVRVIAGEFEGVRGPARTFTPITMLDVNLRKGHSVSAELARGHNALAVVAMGAAKLGVATVKTGELVLLENDGDTLEFEATDDAHVIVLAGRPIAEPIVQYGPFVMTTESEIRQAIADFQAGKMGRVPKG